MIKGLYANTAPANFRAAPLLQELSNHNARQLHSTKLFRAILIKTYSSFQRCKRSLLGMQMSMRSMNLDLLRCIGGFGVGMQ